MANYEFAIAEAFSRFLLPVPGGDISKISDSREIAHIKEQWLRQILSNYETRLIRYVIGLVRDLNIAKDIVQDAFLKLWQQDYKTMLNHEGPWLFTVCRNAAYDYLRKKNLHNYKNQMLLTEVADGLFTPEELLSHKNDKDILTALLKKLTPEQREIIELKFYQDLSYKEISAITGYTVNHVGVLIHNVVAFLAGKLKTLEGGMK